MSTYDPLGGDGPYYLLISYNRETDEWEYETTISDENEVLSALVECLHKHVITGELIIGSETETDT